MALTPADIRSVFPEFADIVAYPDARIQYYLDRSYRMLSTACWGNLLDDGVYQLTAHWIWVGSQTATAGGNFNAAGPIQSKTADKVSYSKQSISVADDWKLPFKSTPYGLEFLSLLDLISAGCSYQVIYKYNPVSINGILF